MNESVTTPGASFGPVTFATVLQPEDDYQLPASESWMHPEDYACKRCAELRNEVADDEPLEGVQVCSNGAGLRHNSPRHRNSLLPLGEVVRQP